MKHLAIITSSLLLLTSSLTAGVPLRWTVETSRAQPATFDEFAGATYDLEATLQSYGKPLEVVGEPHLYWQTNGMGSAYWTAPATVSGHVLRATWTPACDVGARAYNCFIGITGTVYNAAFQFRLRPSPGAVPNVLPLPAPVIDFSQVTVLNPPWPAGSARPLPPYLHELSFDDTYPEDAAWYYAQPQDYGACSAVREYSYFYRNYDWKFDDAATFVIRMSAGPDRFSSIGVANCGTNLTESFVTSHRWSRYYKCLPGRTVDGINGNGVVAEINVVDGTPDWHATGDLHPLAAVRWVLDHATNAQHAAEYLAENIAFPEGWTQNFHYMIADSTKTYIVENGNCLDMGDDRTVMTNFKMYPRTYGTGAERQLALEQGEDITNAWWTLAYLPATSPVRISDIGTDTNTIFEAWAHGNRESHRGQTLGNQTWWQTVHTSVYDINTRILKICVQEQDDWYAFSLNDTASKGDLAAKRDLDDRSYVTYVPGGWTPTEVDGHRYDIYYDGYSGYYVSKLTYYPEWGEWYYDDSEWIEGAEDAETLTAHKLYSDETITFTRLQIEVNDQFALVSQIGNQAEVAARNYIQNNDIAKTRTLLRTGRPGEYGTGWGTMHYQLSSDRRWWSMIVPAITAFFASGGYVDTNGTFVSASTVRFPGQSYAYYRADPISQRDHTPIAKFIESAGTNGSARCSAAKWAVGITAGPGSSSSSVRYDNAADTDAMPFLLTAEVDHASGFSRVAREDRSAVVPIEFDLRDYYTDHYVISNFRFGEMTITDHSASAICMYDVDVSYTSSIRTNYTAWCTLNLGCTAESYVTTNPDYGRVMTDVSRSLWWDSGLKATWRMGVTNGCFFTEIVSTNNLTEGVN